MIAIPQIRIQLSHLLYRGESAVLDKVYNKGLSQIAPLEKYEEKAERYRTAWREYEDRILRGIVDTLGVGYYRNVIDVMLAPYFGNKSAPLVMNFLPEPDVFVDKLTHELLHLIQTDNTMYQTFDGGSGRSLLAEWRRLFGEHEHKELVHIPLQALHKYIYLDVLRQPERMKREMQELTRSPAGRSYLNAWRYVENTDYLVIIEQLRNMYATSR